MTVPITNEISIKLKYPNYGYYMTSQTFFEIETQSEMMTEIVISCLDSVMTEEENISIKDESKEEITRFIESLTSSAIQTIRTRAL